MIAEVTYSEYLAYLKSDHWKDLKKKKYAVTERKCCCCKNPNRLHVHHIRYHNLTDCDVGDLAVICEDCHFYLHQAIKQKKADPSDYPEVWQMLGVIEEYQGTKRGIKVKAKREGRQLEKRNKKSLRKACKGSINQFYHRPTTTDTIQWLINQLEHILSTA